MIHRIKVLLILLGLSFCFSTNLDAKLLDLAAIQEATCRVHAGSAYGTGTVIAEDETSYYVFTNAHVVGQNTYVGLDFFKGGYKTVDELRGEVIWKTYYRQTDADFAVIRINKSLFGYNKPLVVPLAPRGFEVRRGGYIYSSGCPSAQWPMSWQGHVVLDELNLITFKPAPVPGQSGSGVFTLMRRGDELHTVLAAVVTWRIDQGGKEEARGGAIPVSVLYGLIDGTRQARCVPTGYSEIAVGKCLRCGQFLGQHAYASDGKFYCVRTDSFGVRYISNLPANVRILSWNEAHNAHLRPRETVKLEPQPKPLERSLKEHVPFYDRKMDSLTLGTWPFKDERIAPLPNQDISPYPPYGDISPFDRFGRRRPRPSPPSPGPGPGGGNPYGVEPPAIPWSGEPKPDEAPDNGDNGDKGADKPTVPDHPKVHRFPWFHRFRSAGNGLLVALGLAGGVTVLIGVWRRWLKAKTIYGLDKAEDIIQAKVTKLWGKEVGKQVRDALEGLESVVLRVIDEALETSTIAGAAIKARLRDSVIKGLESKATKRRKVTPEDVEKVIEHLANDPSNKTVQPEAVDDVKKVLEEVEKDKTKESTE